MGVALHQAAVHERAGVALVAVADDVLDVALGLAGGLPLVAGGEAPAAPAAQPRLLDLVDDLLGLHLEEHLGQGGVAADRDVVLYRGGIDLVVGIKKEPLLLLVERNVRFLLEHLFGVGIGVQEPRDGSAFDNGLGDDLGHILDLDALVENALRVDGEECAPFAESGAAGRPDIDAVLELLLGDLVLEGLQDIHAAIGQTAGADAERNAGLLRVLPGDNGCPQSFQLLG